MIKSKTEYVKGEVKGESEQRKKNENLKLTKPDEPSKNNLQQKRLCSCVLTDSTDYLELIKKMQVEYRQEKQGLLFSWEGYGTSTTYAVENRKNNFS